ncbi:inositol 2-dehydrogenase [Bacteriovoracales bacterium]|nr:inositol 2-dehydrogenase [Bacteriovoracales bacterium]
MKFALIGTGRIGKMHAEIIKKNSLSELISISDINVSEAKKVGDSLGVKVVEPQHIFEDPNIEAILIASSTATHTDYILQGTKAGKAVFCEKPLSLDIEEVLNCQKKLGDHSNTIQIGFNRRFDPHHLSLKESLKRGVIGKIEKVIITSRDPGLPPVDYLKGSGGIFNDMLIHDFDMAYHLLEEAPKKISTLGSVMVDQSLKSFGDIDTAMVIMEAESGALCHINASRRSVYGYDQRIEVFGEKGMLISQNPTKTTLEFFGSEQTYSRPPLFDFFIDRYEKAYDNQLEDFIQNIKGSTSMGCQFKDSVIVSKMAKAAADSYKTGSVVSFS